MSVWLLTRHFSIQCLAIWCIITSDWTPHALFQAEMSNAQTQIFIAIAFKGRRFPCLTTHPSSALYHDRTQPWCDLSLSRHVLSRWRDLMTSGTSGCPSLFWASFETGQVFILPDLPTQFSRHICRSMFQTFKRQLMDLNQTNFSYEQSHYTNSW